MILTKKPALFFLFINGLFILYSIILLTYINEHIIIDFDNPPKHLSIPVWLTTQFIFTVLFAISFIGLIKVLIQAKERSFIVASTILFLMMRLFFDVFGILISLRIVRLNDISGQILLIISSLIVIYFIMSMCLIKTRSIKKFYVGFAFITLLSVLLGPVTGYLSDHFGLPWVFNGNVLKITPLFISLALYYRLYRFSGQKIQ